MFITGDKLVSIIEGFAPPAYALPGDVTGLQWGDLRREAQAVLFALDFSDEVLDEALEREASFIFTHHPYLFQPLRNLDLQKPREKLIARALAADVALYSAHTNLDVAKGGVNDVLAGLLALENVEILEITGGEELEKLVVFVPLGFEDRVRDALAGAGAGWIGNYSHCTWQVPGTGTFLPGVGAEPFIGSEGRLEKVEEYRLETIFPVSRRGEVVGALLAVHPYEEVAYDLYPLSRRGETRGLGRVGELTAANTLRDLAVRLKGLLGAETLRVHGDLESTVKKIAILGGSGGDYIEMAAGRGADAFITGDIKYHQAQQAALNGLALIDAGHDTSEWPVIPALAAFLREQMHLNGFQTKILISEVRKKMWHYL